MRLIYCTDCRFVAKLEPSSRMMVSLNCDCHGAMQKLAVRTSDRHFEAGWQLSDRAKLVTVADAVFDSAMGWRPECDGFAGTKAARGLLGVA